MKLSIVFFAILNLAKRQTVYAQELDDDVRPSPPSIGADVPVTYFGPPPSSVQKELIGPHQLLTSGQLDEDAGTITIPLYYGRVRNNNVMANQPSFDTTKAIWYILTDTTDLGLAQGLGLNHAPKLRFGNVGRGARWAEMGDNNIMNFDSDSLVDFKPERKLTPGAPPNYFPPVEAEAGSVGYPNYSPLAYVSNLGEVFNAPVVASPDATAEELNAYCEGLPTNPSELADARKIVHDSVVAICPEDFTVTLSLAAGHSFARPVLYLSTDAISEVAAALEGATFAPGLEDISVGDDDSFGSAVERLFAVVNGHTNADIPLSLQDELENHPQRNGFNSALAGDGGPLNVLGGIPTIATDYSPLWDVNIGRWTDEAVAAGIRSRWLEEFQILGFVERGVVTGPLNSEGDPTPFGSSGNIVNCPIVHRFL